MLHAIVMAGGSGTRFWPLSRKLQPKQLLPLWQDRTLLELTLERLRYLVPPARTFVVTGAHLEDAVRKVAGTLPPKNIIVEPAARNTLPCVALAAAVVQSRDEDAVLGVFPADHFIRDREAFIGACREAAAGAKSGSIVTLGVQPDRPETGYGYIEYQPGYSTICEVQAFVEKPNAEVARQYVESGRYLWNAGIFFMQVATLQRELQLQRPKLHTQLGEMVQALRDSDDSALRTVFGDIESISVDYGIMEGAKQVTVVPADFGWNDVGHWGALEQVIPVDSARNVAQGDILAIDTEDCVLVAGSGKVLAVLGLRDLVVVDTPDATLVIAREQVQRVREIVAQLEAEGRDVI